MSTYKPEHILSKKSSEHSRNVFLWSAPSSPLLGGLHVDNNKRSPSVATFHRWISILCVRHQPFELWPVEVRPHDFDICSYVVRRIGGSALVRDSELPLLPGDYAAFPPEDTTRFVLDIGQNNVWSYAEQEKRMLLKYPIIVVQCEANEVLEKREDQFACVITGIVESPPRATWIYPPSLVYELVPEEQTLQLEMAAEALRQQFRHATNTLILCSEIADLFRNNLCGIDVDDNYQIVFFGRNAREMYKKSCIGSSNLADHLRPKESFLRLHFKRCLQVNMTGGDITDDYPEHQIRGFMESLGVTDDEGHWTDPSDWDHNSPAWDTILGRELKALLIRQRMAERLQGEPETDI